MFRRRSWLLSMLICGVTLSSAFAQKDGGKAFLLNAGKGQVPNDTGLENQTKLSSVNSPELGGKAVKVPLAPEDSFGMRSSAVKDWAEHARFRMDAFNPNKQTIELELNIIHSESTDYDTRVTAPIALEPGKNEISIDLEGLTNTNGSAPKLDEVTKWYIADGSKLAKTFFVGNIWLESGEGSAPSERTEPTEPAEMPEDPDAAPSDDPPSTARPKFGFRVRGKIGDQDVDLIVTPLGASDSTPTAEESEEAATETPEPQAAKPKAKSRGPAKPTRRRIATAPTVTRPISFETPEADAIVSAMEFYPANNAMYHDISEWPVHSNSDNIIASIGPDDPLRHNTDMGWVFVPADQKKVPVKVIEIPSESDEGPFPVPDNLPIEFWPAYFQREGKPTTLDEWQRGVGDNGDDRHAIIIDPANMKLYEFWHMKKTRSGWQADQATSFDLGTNKEFRPDGWTSADASGMPIFPLIVRYDEIKRGEINHALRMTVEKSRQEYVYPATHYASDDTNENLPRMGERVRLKADYNVSRHKRETQIVLKAMQKHGIFVNDNGLDWAISVAADPRIPDMNADLRKLKGSDFEVVEAPEGYERPE